MPADLVHRPDQAPAAPLSEGGARHGCQVAQAPEPTLQVGRVLTHQRAEAERAGDRGRISPHPLAGGLEDGEPASVGSGGLEPPCVPALTMAGDDVEQVVTAAVDPDRGVRSLDGQGQAAGVGDPDMGAPEREGAAAEHAHHDLAGLGQLRCPLLVGRTQTNHQAAAGYDVDGGQGLGEDGGRPQGAIEDEGAETDPLGGPGEGAEGHERVVPVVGQPQ